MSLSSRGKSALELALSSSSRRVYTGRWSAVLRYAVKRYATPWSATPWSAALRHATPWSAALRYAAPPWSDRFGVESIFSARRERFAPGNTLKNELYVWSRSGMTDYTALESGVDPASRSSPALRNRWWWWILWHCSTLLWSTGRLEKKLLFACGQFL